MTGFFTGGGASLSFGNPQDPAAFPTFGNRWRGGQILEEGTVQPQTDINTGQPIIRSGKAAEQLALPLLCDGSGPAAEAGMRTDERNPNDHTDTGRRVVYIKGALRFAIGDALRKVGASDLEVGGYLFMMWTGMGKTGNSKFIGRLWQVHYVRPTAAFLAQQQQQTPGVGAMPMQNGAPQHTGFGQQQMTHGAPPQFPAASAPVAPPNPYGQQPSYQPSDAQHAVSGQQWQAQNSQYPADAHTAAAPQSAAPAGNPWGQAPEAQQPPQTPYGPPAPQGTPQPGAPAAGNPWGQ